jgi:hypothetical protein
MDGIQARSKSFGAHKKKYHKPLGTEGVLWRISDLLQQLKGRMFTRPLIVRLKTRHQDINGKKQLYRYQHGMLEVVAVMSHCKQSMIKLKGWYAETINAT